MTEQNDGYERIRDAMKLGKVSYAEIGQVLGITAETVSHNLAEGKRVDVRRIGLAILGLMRWRLTAAQARFEGKLKPVVPRYNSDLREVL